MNRNKISIIMATVIAADPRLLLAGIRKSEPKQETDLKLLAIQKRNDLIRKVKAEEKRRRKAAKKQALFVKPKY